MKNNIIIILVILLGFFVITDELNSHATLKRALNNTADKDWSITTCVGASKDLQKTLTEKGILSVRVGGLSLPCEKEDGCPHQIIFVGYEPQTAKIVKVGEFIPIKIADETDFMFQFEIDEVLKVN